MTNIKTEVMLAAGEIRDLAEQTSDDCGGNVDPDWDNFVSAVVHILYGIYHRGLKDGKQ